MAVGILTGMTANLLSIGTSKGLFLARSDDDRRTWQISGPHFVGTGVTRSRSTPGVSPRGCWPGSTAPISARSWPPVTISARPGRSLTGPRSRSPRTPAPPWSGSGSSRPARRTSRMWSTPAPSRSRCSGPRTAASLRVRARSVGPPAPARMGTRCRRAGDSYGAAPPDQRRQHGRGHVHRWRLPDADGGDTWQPANQGISAVFLPDNFPEFGQCVHKVTRDPNRPEQLFAQNHHGVYRSENGATAGNRSRRRCRATSASRWSRTRAAPASCTASRSAADGRFPADSVRQAYRSEDAGKTWQPLSVGLPEGPFYGASCATRCASTMPSRRRLLRHPYRRGVRQPRRRRELATGGRPPARCVVRTRGRGPSGHGVNAHVRRATKGVRDT